MALNKLQCSTNFANTGVGNCYLVPEHIVGQIIVPESFELDASGDILKQLKDAAEHDNPAQRIFPIHNYVEMEDNSQDPTESTFGYGGMSINKDGFYDLQFRFMKGGICLSNSLRRYNKQSVRTIFIDANGMLFGYRVGDKLKGIPLEMFYVPKFGFPDGDSEAAGFYVRNVFQPKYMNELVAFIDTQALGFDPAEIQGLRDIVFTNAGSTSSKLILKVTTGCGGENLAEVFGTELEDADIWKVKNASNGAEVAVTSVSIEGDNVEVTSAALPSSGTVIVSLDSVSVLTAKGIIGFEGTPSRISIP